MELKETKLSSSMLYEGVIVNVRMDDVELGDGSKSRREVVGHPGGVCVFAIDDNKDVVFVKQYRYPVGEIVTELPAGKLEPGEDPAQSAVRELSEETGLVPQTLFDLGYTYSSPGIFEERIYLYFATDLVQGECHPDEGEFVEVVKIPLAELDEKIFKNEFKDAKTIIGITKAKMWMEKG